MMYSSSSFYGASLDPKEVTEAFPQDIQTTTLAEELSHHGAITDDGVSAGTIVAVDVVVVGVAGTQEEVGAVEVSAGMTMTSSLSSMVMRASFNLNASTLAEANGPVREGPT